MRRKPGLPFIFLSAFFIFIFNSCQKTYTKDEIIAKIKTDRDFNELLEIKANSYSNSLNSTRPLTTPILVQAYKQAKAKGDTAYINSVRAQIYRTSVKERQKQTALHFKLYKRYIRTGLISKENFNTMYKQAMLDEYKKVYTAFYHFNN